MAADWAFRPPHVLGLCAALAGIPPQWPPRERPPRRRPPGWRHSSIFRGLDKASLYAQRAATRSPLLYSQFPLLPRAAHSVDPTDHPRLQPLPLGFSVRGLRHMRRSAAI